MGDAAQAQNGQPKIAAHAANLTVQPLAQHHLQQGIAANLLSDHIHRHNIFTFGKVHAAPHGLERPFRRRAAHKHFIGLGLVMPGMGKALGQLAIIGKQQQSLRKIVKSANRIQPERLVFRRKAIQHGGPAFRVAHCANHMHGLVEHEVGIGLRGRQHASIHGNALKGQYLTPGVGLRLAVNTNAPGKNKFVCLWVVDFPMFEWSDEEGRLMAMHHPFTHPKDEDIPLLDTDPAAVRADAYDMVCNGIEVGGGSIRIHDAQLQAKMFEILGFTPEKAQEQFGFLMNAFKYGAPPHGGLAYGLDRWVSIFAGLDSIRDCIAFPKNNSGRDVMLDAPSAIDQKQLDELNLIVEVKE